MPTGQHESPTGYQRSTSMDDGKETWPLGRGVVVCQDDIGSCGQLYQVVNGQNDTVVDQAVSSFISVFCEMCK